jgi:hypothetical protein
MLRRVNVHETPPAHSQMNILAFSSQSQSTETCAFVLRGAAFKIQAARDSQILLDIRLHDAAGGIKLNVFICGFSIRFCWRGKVKAHILMALI